jgi:hypothetical protein
MTYEEIVQAAMERASEFGATGNLVRSTLYYRMGRRQSQLFQRSAVLNPDFYGVCIVVLLSADRAADLEDVPENESPVGRIERVEIADPGSSAWPARTTVAVVPLNDPDSAIAPRVTMREFVLRGVSTDLTGVVSLRIYYTKQARPVRPSDGERVAEIREPYVHLLVLDLAQFVLKQMQLRGAEGLDAAIASIKAEEDELVKDYETHMTHIVLDVADRFRRFGVA